MLYNYPELHGIFFEPYFPKNVNMMNWIINIAKLSFVHKMRIFPCQPNLLLAAKVSWRRSGWGNVRKPKININWTNVPFIMLYHAVRVFSMSGGPIEKLRQGLAQMLWQNRTSNLKLPFLQSSLTLGPLQNIRVGCILDSSVHDTP